MTTELKRGKQTKIEIISKFGSIKVNDNEETAFTGSRIQATEFLMVMVDFAPHPHLHPHPPQSPCY